MNGNSKNNNYMKLINRKLYLYITDYPALLNICLLFFLANYFNTALRSQPIVACTVAYYNCRSKYPQGYMYPRLGITDVNHDTMRANKMTKEDPKTNERNTTALKK